MNRPLQILAMTSLLALLGACGSDDSQSPAGNASDDTGSTPSNTAAATEATAEVMQEAADEVASGETAAQNQNAETMERLMSEFAAAANEMNQSAQESAQEAVDETAAAAQESADQVAAAVQEAMPVAAAPADDGDPCSLSVEVGDNIAYSVDSMTVPASCGDVTVTITHTGNLPAVAMGHNWVLLPSDALDAIAMAGMSAGPGANYVPDDDRIVAATGVVGGGESDSVTFSLGDLAEGVSYQYVCTFPGHSAVMRGTFTVSG